MDINITPHENTLYIKYKFKYWIFLDCFKGYGKVEKHPCYQRTSDDYGWVL